MGGFRDCVSNVHFLTQYMEIQGLDLIAGCVIIRHAHTNKPQPALNKIQVRTSVDIYEDTKQNPRKD